MKKPIELTQRDLHALVEESVRTYLKENGEDEGVWGGVKNAAKGIGNWNFNLGQTYKTGNWASSFEKYAKNAENIINGMKNIATKSQNQGVANSLDQINAV
jgi:hypothetical protein